MGSKGNIFSIWLRATRFPFLTASFVPAGLGAALSFRDGFFSWDLFLLVMMAIAGVNIGTNLANDYYDFKSGADQLNLSPTPFSGGSRIIQENLLSPGQIFFGSLTAYVFSTGIGLFLINHVGAGLLWFGVPGILLSYFYTAPPLRLGYRGWGEIVVGVLLGPLAVMGAYFVFSGSLSPESFFLSLTPGFLVTAILFINQFPDREADSRAGKRHWVTRLQPLSAVRVYIALIATAFLLPLVFVLLNVLPAGVLLCFLALPLALRAIALLRRLYDRPLELIPAQELTIQAHLIAGLGVIAGVVFL